MIDGPRTLKQLIWCIDSGFPAPVTEALLALVDDPWGSTLREARDTWDDWRYNNAWDHYYGTFVEAVEMVTDQPVVECGCGRVVWETETTRVVGGEQVCDDSCLGNYFSCGNCEEYVDETFAISGVHERSWCVFCRRRYATFCENCGEYYANNDDHDFNHEDDDDNNDGDDHMSCCNAPHPNFQFHNDGHGLVWNNERVTVELPEGTIDVEGIARIKRYLECYVDRYVVEEVVSALNPQWVMPKGGSFTKRLSTALHKKGVVKLQPGIISEIGNIAQQHASSNATWHIEFTRDLNLPAADFAHSASCYWNGYVPSRCCLKNWGGLGLRAYRNAITPSSTPNGRIWVQPLDSALQPTHDTLNARGYVLFNGYGTLEGFTASRIIAHLTSRTYRKIELTTGHQYINGSTGFLVADAATIKAVTVLRFTHDPHDQRDARQLTLDLAKLKEALDNAKKAAV